MATIPSIQQPSNVASTVNELSVGSFTLHGDIYDVVMVYKDSSGARQNIPQNINYQSFTKTSNYALDVMQLLTDFHANSASKPLMQISSRGAHLANTRYLQSHNISLEQEYIDRANAIFRKHGHNHQQPLPETGRDLYQAAHQISVTALQTLAFDHVATANSSTHLPPVTPIFNRTNSPIALNFNALVNKEADAVSFSSTVSVKSEEEEEPLINNRWVNS